MEAFRTHRDRQREWERDREREREQERERERASERGCMQLPQLQSTAKSGNLNSDSVGMQGNHRDGMHLRAYV